MTTKSSYGIPGEKYAPPADMTVTIENEEEGSGPACSDGDSVTMKYVGKLEDGTVFDQADKFKFTIAAGDVIKVGMPSPCGCRGRLGLGRRGMVLDKPPRYNGARIAGRPRSALSIAPALTCADSDTLPWGQGWDKGVAGMKKGGKRTLIIPPK